MKTAFKRIVYLGYYFKKMDWPQLRKFTKFYARKYKTSALAVFVDSMVNSLKYNVSILEYFMFDFRGKSHEEKLAWAGTGYMYEYQQTMNPLGTRDVLSDKIKFLNIYEPYIKHGFASIDSIKKDHGKADELIQNNSGKVVLKSSDGQCGIGIEVRNSADFSADTLVTRLVEMGNDFVEEYVVQHDDLMRLSPSGLNTLRIITQLDKNDEVKVLGARLRISVGQPVDNLAAGNLAAFVDLNTGKVNAKAVYSDITKEPTDIHPITKEPILGFQIPFWEESLKAVKEAALHDISNRSIGWDVAITNNGPDLIEGNHDWCKLLWQLPAEQGLKPVLEQHKREYLNRKKAS